MMLDATTRSTTQRDPLRQLLRNAISKRGEAQRAVTQAQSNLERAETWLKGKQAIMSRDCANVDELLAAARLEIEKRFIAKGGVGRREDISVELAHRIKMRDQLVVDIRAAESAGSSYKVDLDNARVALATAERQASQCAAAIIMQEAKTIAAELRAADKIALELRYSLRGCASLWTPNESTGELKPIALPRDRRVVKFPAAIAPPQ
jgi:hypothetical protein